MKKAFSLIELSIVILIIGILVAGVTQGSRLVTQMKLNTARSVTQSSPVASISGLVLWLESTSEKSFDDVDEENGNPISNWYDINPQSILKTSVTAATTARPTYNTASGSINGLPTVKFDGTANIMTTTSGSNLPSTSPLTIFVVAKLANVTGTPVFGGFKQNGSGWRYGCVAANYIFTAWTVLDVIVGVCDINPNINTLVVTSVGVPSFYKNGGTPVVGAAAIPVGGETTFSIGGRMDSGNNGGYFLTGQIGEVIMFSSALKPADRQAVEAYLSKKWAIKVS